MELVKLTLLVAHELYDYSTWVIVVEKKEKKENIIGVES